MKLNPIIKRDMQVLGRSRKLAVLVSLTNAVLSAVGLLGLFGRLAGYRLEQYFDYRSTFTVYGYTAGILFLTVLFLFPALTSGSISTEYANGTLDLMLAGGLSPAMIVTGKFFSALIPSLVLLFSFLPALVMPLIFGGVEILGCGRLLVLYVPFALLLLSAGLFASAAGKRSGITPVIAYGIALGITVLPLILAVLPAVFWKTGGSRAAYLIVLSPLTPLAEEFLKQVGEERLITELLSRISMPRQAEFISYGVLIGTVLELMLAAVFFGLTVHNVAAGRKPGRGRTPAES